MYMIGKAINTRLNEIKLEIVNTFPDTVTLFPSIFSVIPNDDQLFVILSLKFKANIYIKPL